MPTEKATALVLRIVEFSETSLIATLYTREFGKIGALAKGGRRLKSPFESALDLLALCRIVFLRKQSDSLDLLTEAKLLRRFRIPQRGLDALYAAYYVAELLDVLTDRYDPCPELFDAADATLIALSGGEDPCTRTFFFEFAALRCTGHMPTIDYCAGCGVPVGRGLRGQVFFGLQAGGVLCDRCRPQHRPVASVDTSVLEVIRQMTCTPQSPGGSSLPKTVVGPLRGLLTNYIAHLIGRRPRMARQLAELSGHVAETPMENQY